jgi:CRISPR-associated protein Csh1
MLNAMRNLALLELNRRFGTHSADLAQLRRDHGTEINSLLVESGEKIPRVYLLQADPEREDVVRMWSEEITHEKAGRLPFTRPSGSQSGAIGPVFKRSYKRDGDPPHGPSRKILETTRKDFGALAAGETSWAGYFREVNRILFEATGLEYAGATYPIGDSTAYKHVLEAAVALIPDESPVSVFLSVVDNQRRWPGDREEYQAYLTHTLAETKYTTGSARAHEEASCPLCGATHTTVYPNALKGAGINFANMDRVGAFPGLNKSQAWKGYAVCLDCADLLYIFKFHFLDKFIGQVAGKKALLLTSLLGNKTG